MSNKNTLTIISDNQRLIGAKSRFGTDIPVHDNGWGKLFIHRDSSGINGIVRTRTWEEAYEIVEDEFLPEATETIEELEKEFSTIYCSGRDLWLRENGSKPGAYLGSWEKWEALTKDEKDLALRAPGKDLTFPSGGGGFSEHPCFQEQYGFRPNGRRSVDKDGKDRDPIGHGIYAKDLNGDALDEVTERLLAELEITLLIEDDDRPEKLAGIKHDISRARNETYCARWAAVKIEKFTAEEALEINEKLTWIETDIKELRATLGIDKLK